MLFVSVEIFNISISLACTSYKLRNACNTNQHINLMENIKRRTTTTMKRTIAAANVITRPFNMKSVLIILWIFIIIIESSPILDGNGNQSSNAGFKISLLKGPEKNRETVNLERETLTSKIKSTYDRAQQKANENAEILPILDTIKEEEKYGNNGDQFDSVSRSIINGYEAFSNFLNTLIEKPKEILRSLSKGLTNQLDVVGGKLVGL